MIKIGDKVQWKWGKGTASAEVIELHAKSTTIETKGKEETRNGTKDNNAVVLRNQKGVTILKLESEIDKN